MSRIYEAMKRSARADEDQQADYGLSRAPRMLKRVSPSLGEEYQRLAQSVSAPVAGEQVQVILVVSAIKGEGTSTVARNLARTLSDNGVTLLMDANLRSPTQHLAFGLEQNAGLIDVFNQSMVLEQVLNDGNDSGLTLLTSGETTNGPPPFLTPTVLENVMANLRGKFEWIVVDAPPVTVYSDASAIAKHVDGIILVVQAERTRWEVVDQAKRTLQESNAPILGAVLNRRKYHIPKWFYRYL